MVLDRIGLLFVFITFLAGCKCGTGKLSIEGEYVVTGSSIFLTAFSEEKQDLYKACVKKKVQIRSDKLYADTTCIFFERIKDITITDSFQTTVDKFPVLNSSSFAYFVDEDVESRRSILAFKGMVNLTDGTRDSMQIVKKSIDTIILVWDPYVLEMVRAGGKSGF